MALSIELVLWLFIWNYEDLLDNECPGLIYLLYSSYIQSWMGYTDLHSLILLFIWSIGEVGSYTQSQFKKV